MTALNDQFWAKLSDYLRKLHEVARDTERDLSWKSAEEILAWWGTWGKPFLDAEGLNRALLAEWRNRRATTKIRFAKYPSRSTLSMLWGHEECVRAGDPDLNELAAKPLLEFESIPIAVGAPQIFVSYSLRDVHFASRVRWVISRDGIRTWIAGGEVRKDQMLVEGVKYALNSSVAVVGLLSRHSLSSAWFDTELYSALHLGKRVILACDSTDEVLMEILGKWNPSDSYKFSTFEKERLLRLMYQLGGTLSESRFSKYQTSAEAFLSGLRTWKCDLTVFPRRPMDWEGSDRFKDFEVTWKDVATSIWESSSSGGKHPLESPVVAG